MELKDQQTISLPIEKVWAALNDPDILRQCVPGCDTFESAGENQYRVVMTASVGPIQAKFTGKLQLTDIVPPTSYRLNFEGSGGAAGSGKGRATVQLSETPGGTVLAYAVQATVGGRLAQVGARLIDGVARKMADQFFSRFKAIVEPQGVQAGEPVAAPGRQAEAPSGTARRGKRFYLVPALAAAAVAAISLFLYLN